VIVLFREVAESDLEEIIAYYADIDLRLALRFQDEFESVMERIAEFPQAFAVVHADLRRAGLQRFPHGIYFRLVRPDLVVIVAVVHPSRNPRQWEGRR